MVLISKNFFSIEISRDKYVSETLFSVNVRMKVY